MVRIISMPRKVKGGAGSEIRPALPKLKRVLKSSVTKNKSANKIYDVVSVRHADGILERTSKMKGKNAKPFTMQIVDSSGKTQILKVKQVKTFANPKTNAYLKVYGHDGGKKLGFTRDQRAKYFVDKRKKKGGGWTAAKLKYFRELKAEGIPHKEAFAQTAHHFKKK